MNRIKPMSIEESSELPEKITTVLQFLTHAFENALINFYNKISDKK